MNRIQTGKTVVAAPTPDHFSTRINGLLIDIDWNTRECRVFGDRIEVEEVTEEMLQRARAFQPDNYYLEVDGGLHKIRRISVVCSDVQREEAYEESDSCCSRKQFPQRVCSNAPSRSNNSVCQCA